MCSLLHPAAARATRRLLLTSVCAGSNATWGGENALRAFHGSTPCSRYDGWSRAERHRLSAPFPKIVEDGLHTASCINISSAGRLQLPVHLLSPPGSASCNGSGHSAICRVRRICRHNCCLLDGPPGQLAPLHAAVCLLGSCKSPSGGTDQAFRGDDAQPRCEFTSTRGALPLPPVLTVDVAQRDNAEAVPPMETDPQFFRRRSLANLRLSRRYGSSSIHVGALAIAALIALPFEAEREREGLFEGQNKGSPVTAGGSAAESRATCCRVEADSTSLRPFSEDRPFLCRGSMEGSIAEAVHGYISSIRHLMAGGAGGEAVGGSSQASAAANTVWEALQPRLRLLQGTMTEALTALRRAKAKEYVLCSDSPSVVKPESPYVKLELRGPTGQRRSAVDESAAKSEVYGHSDISGHKREHTALPTSHSLFYRAAEEGVAEASSSPADLHRGPGQQSELFASDTPAYDSGVSRQRGGWLAALARSIRVFFLTLASVCQRLVFAVPLAAIAATAGLWLYALPYIVAGLQMVGLRGQWVLRWAKVAQGELEEIVFTSVTAAASAAGPTYVKFLQWIATRPDLFNETLCARCAKLQTQVRPFSYPRAALLLRDQFGDDVARHLILDPSPIGCGCIAQVYRAYLLPSKAASEESKRFFLQHAFALGGNTSTPVCGLAETKGEIKVPPVAVAVKVMRPGVREAMDFDLRLMLLVASALQCLPAFGFVAIKRSVEEFAVAMRRQLDFGLEEKHLKKFRSNFGLPPVLLPDDLLPLRNKRRRTTAVAQANPSAGEMREKKQHASILSSLPAKILGMRRQVTFPYPFEGLSSSELLVMTLEGGFTLNHLFKLRRKREQAKESLSEKEKPGAFSGSAKPGGFGYASFEDDTARSTSAAIKIIDRFNSVGLICLHSFLQMVFLDNFFHGDMHSGNLLCRFARNSKDLVFPVVVASPTSSGASDAPWRDGPLELVVLDCGLAGSLSEDDRANFVTLLEAVGQKRGKDAAMAMLQRARKSACKDVAGFCREVDELINEHHFEEGNSLQMRRVRFTSLMGRMLSLSKKYSVELDPAFVSIVVAMSVLEGVGAQLCPDADVLRVSMPYSLLAAKLMSLASSRKN